MNNAPVLVAEETPAQHGGRPRVIAEVIRKDLE